MTSLLCLRGVSDTLTFVIEESVESFILQFKPYAADVEILPHIEGSPLLECLVAGKILHLMERTAPYISVAGRAKVILNAVSESVSATEETTKAFSAPVLGRLKAQGVVLEREQRVLVIDASVPLVVSSFSDIPPEIAPGDWIKFESLAPIHGFVMQPEKRSQQREGGEGDSI